MILGIDASSPGSGGAKRHLIELLECFNSEEHGFTKVKIWGVSDTLTQMPNSEKIEKLSHAYLNKGLFYRTIWQLFYRDIAFKNQFDVLFSPFGTYTGKFRPYVSMSRNMLVFDREERRRFGLSWMRLKFKILFYKQKRSFRNAQGLIFLSQNAMRKIQEEINLKGIKTQIIHHGVSNKFRSEPRKQHPISSFNFKLPYKLLYVSTVLTYKHPWNVLEAVAKLRKENYPVSISFVGKDEQKRAGKRLEKAIKKFDPNSEYVKWYKNIDLNEVSTHYQSADAFVYASTCENMPNILIEAMSSGLPIVCSSFAPMPEFLKEGGLYFDPTNVNQLESVIKKILLDVELRSKICSISFEHSQNYSWTKCADQTFSFLHLIGREYINNKNYKE